MMKKVSFCLVVLSVFMLALPLVLGNGNNNDVITVGSNGDYNYSSIQDAVDAAEEGDTIVVYNGTYEENVSIDKEGLNLKSYEVHGAVINGLVSISGDFVVLEKFMMRDYQVSVGGDPVIHITGKNAVVANMDLYLESFDGNQPYEIVVGSEAENVKIVANKIDRGFEGGHPAISLDGSNNMSIIDNDVAINGSSAIGGAIEGNVTITGNTVHNGFDEGFWFTVPNPDNTNLTFEKNEVVNYNVGGSESNAIKFVDKPSWVNNEEVSTAYMLAKIVLDSNNAENLEIGGNKGYTDNIEIEGKGYFYDIQDAVDAAEEGDTILVGPGIYEENLVINVEDLTLKGLVNEGNGVRPPEGPILPMFEMAMAIINGSVEITGKGAVLESFKIVNGGVQHEPSDVGVYVNVTSKIYSCWITEITGNNPTGIMTETGTDDVEIINNHIDNVWRAIYLNKGNGLLVENNTIEMTDYGISTDEQSNLFITHNKINEVSEELIGASNVGEGFDVTHNDLTADSSLAWYSGENINAIHNYWGQSSGPTEDQVKGDVEYMPWLLQDIEHEPALYDITISFTDGWTGFSLVHWANDLEIAGNDPIIYWYDAGEDEGSQWRLAEEISNPLYAYAGYEDVEAIGYNIDGDRLEPMNRELNKGWNFVGAYVNLGEDENLTGDVSESGQHARNVFSPIKASLNSIYSPLYNQDLLDNDINQGTIWDFSSVEGTASPFNGYWLRASEDATLSTTPTMPEVEE